MATWVMDLMYSAGYLGVVFLMFLENLFPPLPAEIIMPLAGYMVTQHRFSLAGIIVAGTAGSMLGALVQYYTGLLVGEKRVKELAGSYGRWLTVSPGDIDRAKRWFDRHGSLAVFICRLLPGLHAFISIPAGVDRMNLGAFLIHTVAGGALWSALLASAGYLLGGNVQRVGDYLDPLSYIVLGIVVALYVVRLITHWKRA